MNRELVAKAFSRERLFSTPSGRRVLLEGCLYYKDMMIALGCPQLVEQPQRWLVDACAADEAAA